VTGFFNLDKRYNVGVRWRNDFVFAEFRSWKWECIYKVWKDWYGFRL